MGAVASSYSDYHRLHQRRRKNARELEENLKRECEEGDEEEEEYETLFGGWLQDSDIDDYINALLHVWHEGRETHESPRFFYVNSLASSLFVRGMRRVGRVSNADGSGDEYCTYDSILKKIGLSHGVGLQRWVSGKLGIIVLHHRMHWSVLLYLGRDDGGDGGAECQSSTMTFHHYDSIPGCHRKYAIEFLEHLAWALFADDDGNNSVKEHDPPSLCYSPKRVFEQENFWECGYYVLWVIAGAIGSIRTTTCSDGGVHVQQQQQEEGQTGNNDDVARVLDSFLGLVDTDMITRLREEIQRNKAPPITTRASIYSGAGGKSCMTTTTVVVVSSKEETRSSDDDRGSSSVHPPPSTNVYTASAVHESS